MSKVIDYIILVLLILLMITSDDQTRAAVFGVGALVMMVLLRLEDIHVKD